MTGIIAIILALAIFNYAVILQIIFNKKQEKERQYKIERAKVELIIAQYQTAQLGELLFDKYQQDRGDAD